MDGKIFLESSEEKGSKFCINFQNVVYVNNKSPLSIEEVIDYKKINFQKATVLIVDDVLLNREVIKRFLKKANLTILEAENGEEAISVVKSHLPHLILMDLRMPVMDGLKATQLIKSDNKFSSIPIIASTASATNVNFPKEDLKIFDGFLQKPIRVNELFKELIKYLKYN